MNRDVPEGQTALATLREAILSGRNRDGGWGYVPGKASRLEPTAWALLALLSDLSSDITRSVVESALGRLKAWQGSTGLMYEPDGECNLAFNAVALLAASAAHATAATPLADRMTASLMTGLIASSGAALTDARDAEASSADGWPWRSGTYSWVEPTAWCLLALKRKGGPRTPPYRDRIVRAEKVLRDRACRGGGWNYGNAVVLGQHLSPYVPTTAVALLALQDSRLSPAVREGLAFLESDWRREASGMSFALTAICFAVYGRDSSEARAALWAAFQRTHFLGNLCVAAMALVALSTEGHATRIFRL